jgi:Peptidase family M23
MKRSTLQHPYLEVKVVLAPIVLAVLLLMSIPLVFANGGNAAAPYACGQIGVILDTIRTLESGGDYTVRNSHASAAGAYQYVTATWQYWAGQADVDTDQYPTADTAPPEIQDLVAAKNVTSILQDHDNLVEAVPVIWYYPVAWNNTTTMDQIPPYPGNTLTVRQYQTKWIGVYSDKLLTAGNPAPAHPTPVPVAPASPVPPPAGEVNDANGAVDDDPAGESVTTGRCSGALDATGQWALPAPRDTMNPTQITSPHHDYPAWDLIIATGTPIFAVTGGTVARTTHFAGNWDRDGCNGNNKPSGCQSCGIGITIQSPEGLRHTYCHNSELHVAEGDPITPGQLIATSGDTGKSGTPHLHLEFRINNIRHCPQPLVLALYNSEPVPEPATLPTSGCSF